MFILQNAPTGQAGGAGEAKERRLEIGGLGVDSETAKFDLTLYLTQGEQVTGFFEYNTDLFDRGTLERLAHHYLVLLRGIVADPDRPLAAYELMEEDERRQVVEDWNATAADYPDLCFHQLFERQVDERPDAIALVAEDATYTYRELDQAGQSAGPPADRPRPARPKASSASAPTAPRGWWSPCSACSRPAAPTCRWTPATRPTGWPS